MPHYRYSEGHTWEVPKAHKALSLWGQNMCVYSVRSLQPIPTFKASRPSRNLTYKMLFGIVTRRHFFGNGAYHDSNDWTQQVQCTNRKEKKRKERKRKEKKEKEKERKENIGLYYAGMKFELF